MWTRRELLSRSLAAVTVASWAPNVVLGETPASTPPTSSTPPGAAGAGGPFEVPPLPYPLDALEPWIDAQTMGLHHDKHHAAYVKGLNSALAEQPQLATKSVEELLADLNSLPESIRTAVRNHGGGHANHSLFWKCMAPKPAPRPAGELAVALDRRFASFDAFTEQFQKAAMGVFGSGWAWLTVGAAGSLAIETTPNQETPLSAGRQPIFGLDLWEHAYYLKYQNRRADYISAWLHVVDWEAASARYRDLTARRG